MRKGEAMTNYGLDRRNQEARAGIQTSRKGKMMAGDPTEGTLRALVAKWRADAEIVDHKGDWGKALQWAYFHLTSELEATLDSVSSSES
jgi:hypothetical protein